MTYYHVTGWRSGICTNHPPGKPKFDYRYRHISYEIFLENKGIMQRPQVRLRFISWVVMVIGARNDIENKERHL